MTVNQMFDIKDKVVVITGGSVGLGSYMAAGFAEAGANLVIAARKVERCVELCKDLERYQIKAVPAACDVSNYEDCKRLVDLTIESFGRLDILVNNAGISWTADAMDHPMDKWNRVIGVNLTGLFQLSALAARVMKEQGAGKIINIASVSAFLGSPPEGQNTVAYNASKGAVITLTKDLAVKWARYGITVNAIAPGYFPTDLNRKLLERIKDRVLPRIPLGRFGEPDDLRGVVIFLSSPAANYITGQTIILDGGRTCW
jgi:NAD(P)-dependent dehydrogenase (short-subunit alcohol dehydrogenase family)